MNIRLSVACLMGVLWATTALADPPPVPPPTPQQVMADLTTRANGGDAQAAYDLAQVYVEGIYGQKKNPKLAAQWTLRAAQGGLAKAEADYAGRLESGKGVNPDFNAALGWYQKAADQGDVGATLHMCETFTQNPAVTPDWGKALPYCRTAAGSGAPTALYALGLALVEGKATPADPVQGLKYLDAAASKDNGDALEALGEIYSSGQYVPQNYAQGLTYFRKAAVLGKRDAVLHMAQQIDAGQGTAADPHEAARLYDVLIRGGHDDDSATAQTWLTAHPQFKRAQFADNILKVSDVARDTIFYAVDSDDPRFQTLDMAGYFDYLSQNSYPAEAQNDAIEGNAAAECRFTATGDFDDCVLISENPKGHGFGAALMNIFNHLGASGNKIDWASRYSGKVLRVSMRWKLN
ncbi:tetratricopeptide repeat protein [Asticcacaulis sp. EMRT-3]|uniref:tetratricopeptide repeat protein n=1 Tax=Asticcacaulis sp. EMRT-3 TaxID=3040349 RepID=UPI0024AF4FA1|nr:tetratricopeptide repeat protein [Asticcacaulis sp. EMRT-3]MDI7774076.1 tetratricopeptide repeat protein [Asticcacaulis sp. EMRT-3]